MQGRIFVSYFFENEDEKVIIVNGERYHSVLTDFIPQIEDMEQADIHFLG